MTIHPRMANAQQAKLLFDPAMLTPVHALMREQLSAAELADKLGLPLRRVVTLLGKLQRAGIAEVLTADNQDFRGVPLEFIGHAVNIRSSKFLNHGKAGVATQSEKTPALMSTATCWS